MGRNSAVRPIVPFGGGGEVGEIFRGGQLGTQTNTEHTYNLVENSWGIARTQTLLLSSR